MPYRETKKVSERKQAVGARILEAARLLLAEDGYRGARMTSVASRAGVATGTVYRYFPSKTTLLTEVFRNASGHELEALEQAAEVQGSAQGRLRHVIYTFAERALRGRRLAYTLLAEPAMSEVDEERLIFRRAYARLMQRLVEEGIAAGEFPPQDSQLAAAALVGALSEALVGPLSSPIARPEEARELIPSILDFCLRAVSAEEANHDANHDANHEPSRPRRRAG